MAVRQRGRLQSYYAHNTVSEGKDFDNMAVSLSNQRIAERLVAYSNPNIFLKYFSGAFKVAGASFPGKNGGSSNHMFGQLNFSANESLANNLRLGFNNKTLALTTTFVDAEGANSSQRLKPISSTPNDSRYAYGRQFELDFSLGHGLVGSGAILNPRSYNSFTKAPSRVLRAVAERNLENLQTEGKWVCPKELKFLIVRPEDNTNHVLCGYNSLGSGLLSQKEILKMRGYTQEVPYQAPLGVKRDHHFVARHVLGLEHWHVDFARRCVVPKNMDDKCYGGSTNFQQNPINYSAELGRDGTGNCGTNTTCPHYVSICYKTQ